MAVINAKTVDDIRSATCQLLKSMQHLCERAQGFLYEMNQMLGTPAFDLMAYFDADHLDRVKERFLQVMEEYLEEYHKVGKPVNRYDTFEQLYEHYMNLSKG